LPDNKILFRCFDDEGCSAALDVLADLSARTQVLLFTHHARVVELARDLGRSSEVLLHDLG